MEDQSSPVAAGGRGLRNGLIRLFFSAVAIVVAWIALVPLAMLLFSSLAAGENKLPFEAHSLTLHNYLQAFGNLEIYRVILTTAIFAFGTTALGVGTSVFFAWLIERTNIWGRRFFFVAILVPMAIPNMIYAMSWIQLLAPNNGLITVTLEKIGLGILPLNLFSLPGMIFVQGIALASHAYLLVAAPFRALDPTWEEQSAIAGKNIFVTLWRISLPVLKPALLGALIFFFIITIETFDIPVTLGLTARINVLSTSIYWATYPESGQLPNYGLASALSMVMLLVTFALLYLYQQQTRDAKRYVTITGRGYRQHRIALGRWRLPLFLFACLFVLTAVILPMFILVWRSLLRFYMYPSAIAFAHLSLASYYSIFSDVRIVRSVYNTVVMAASSGFICMVMAAMIAWLVVRAPIAQRYRDGLRHLAFLPQAMPTIVIGLALIFIYIWLPISIYGTIWIIVLAMVTRFMAYSTATMIGAQLQVSTELEEASMIAGAGRLRTYRRIVLPLIMPTILSCFLWVFIHSVRELGMSLMLYSARSEVLSTKVWLLWEGGRVGQVCAVGVLTVVALIVLLTLPWVVRQLGTLTRVSYAPAPVSSASLLRRGNLMVERT